MFNKKDFDEKKWLEDSKKNAEETLRNNPHAILFRVGDEVIIRKEDSSILKTDEVNNQGLEITEI